VTFSKEDNASIEAAYQKILEDLEDERSSGSRRKTLNKRKRTAGSQDAPNTNFQELDHIGGEGEEHKGVRVPVNEDFLFDVDIEERELAPAYWLGPVYDVRRGSWFYQEGSTLRPCEENLASQLEEGYLKAKPWLYPRRDRVNTAGDVTPKSSAENLKAAAAAQGDGPSAVAKPPSIPTTHQPQTHRLFGTYMNNVATYHDATTAFLSSDTMLSWVTSTVFERFSGGGYMSGIKLVRGYSEQKKAKEEKRPVTPTGTKPTQTVELDEAQQKRLKRRSAPPSSRSRLDSEDNEIRDTPEFETRGSQLQRQLSSLMESAETRDPEKQEEQIRQREEKEIANDYNARVGETQGRDIEHLVLVTHGIGQLLGMR